MSMDIHETAAVRRLNERLAAANHFDPQTLMLNRLGQLAPSQRKLVLRRARWLAFFFLALLGIGLYQYARGGLPQGGQALILTGMYALALAFLGVQLFLAFRDAAAGRVVSVEGEGAAIYERSRDQESNVERFDYYYQIGERRFAVRSEEAFQALVNGLRYRAYYLPRSGVLVNIEALEAPPEGEI